MPDAAARRPHATSGGGGKRSTTGALLGGAAGAVIGNVWSTRMENQRRTMEQATRGTGVQVTQTQDNRLKLEIPSDISFDTGRADIKGNFRPILDRFASGLVENPAAQVTIIGHTDSTGGTALNNQLSIDRAASTRNYLASRGVQQQRIFIEGRGEGEPIASNDNEAGRARNRRVEIYVAEPQTQAQAPQYQQPQSATAVSATAVSATAVSAAAVSATAVSATAVPAAAIPAAAVPAASLTNQFQR